MQHRTEAPPHDFAITTKFCRPPVDVDDTVPVALYTRPYERLDIQPDTRPYELLEIALEIEIETETEDDAPRLSFPVVLTISMLCGALALGVGVAFLLL